MNYSGSVYELVLSLTKTEKRYFKLFARLNKQESNLIRLFDTISIRGLHTDKEVKDHFGSESFVRHFDVYKVHLKEIILHSMRNFHQNRNQQSVLHNNIEDARFLFAKGLFKQSSKLILKSKLLAEETGNLTALIDLITLERHLPAAKENFQNNTKKLHQLHKEEAIVIKKLLVESELGFKIASADLLIKKFAETGNEIVYFSLTNLFEEIAKSEMELTAPLQRKLFLTQAEFHTFIHQYAEAKNYLDRLIKSYESSSVTLRENVEYYIKSIEDRISLCIQLNHLEDAWRLNEDLKNVPILLDKVQKRNTKLLAHLDGYYLQNTLKIYLTCGEIGKTLAFIVETELFLSRKNNKISIEIQIELITLNVYYYFMNQEYDKAETLIELHSSVTTFIKNRHQAINLALLKYLLVYGKGNRKTSGAALRSLYRHLLRGKGLSQFENICLDILKRSAKQGSASISKSTWEKMLLRDLKQLESGPFWENRSIRFDLISWLESRQKKKPLFQILRENHPFKLP